jgi:cyclophilin family peptidyl-prolyl cis-trans isomerase
LIRIETFPETAPHGVKRLTELVESGFFDGMPFFRAIPNFLIQMTRNRPLRSRTASCRCALTAAHG